jgi:hypothetical protein
MQERQNGGGTRNGTGKKGKLKNNTGKEGRKKMSLSHTNKILSRKDRNSRTFWQYELA